GGPSLDLLFLVREPAIEAEELRVGAVVTDPHADGDAASVDDECAALVAVPDRVRAAEVAAPTARVDVGDHDRVGSRVETGAEGEAGQRDRSREDLRRVLTEEKAEDRSRVHGRELDVGA